MKNGGKEGEYRAERDLVDACTDVQQAIKVIGLSPAVVAKFGDQLSYLEFMTSVRTRALGSEKAIKIPATQEEDHEREEIYRTAHSMVVRWMRHSDPAVQRFARRMNVALNTQGYPGVDGRVQQRVNSESLL